MNTVKAIKEKDDIRNIARYLKDRNERDRIMFLMGIYTGLRISDILKLRVEDVKGKDTIRLRENKKERRDSEGRLIKQGKQLEIQINPEFAKILKEYLEDKDPDDYLIKSQKNYNRPIGRSQAYKIIKSASEACKVKGIATHSLRKTFGYSLYKQSGDLLKVSLALNHKDISVTKRYIGIDQEDLDDTLSKMRYFL